MKNFSRATILLIIVLLFSTFALASAQSLLPINTIQLPAGFRIEVYASGIPNARSLAIGTNGTVFVGSRSAGRVYAVSGAPGATQTRVIASGLNSPNGVAFLNGSLYVAEITRILRYDNIEASLTNPPQPVVIYNGFPNQSLHGWKFIRFGPDGKLYVPNGAPCNICKFDANQYGVIMRMNTDGSGLEVYARGIRNTVGFDWQPGTGALWFTDNGIDTLGDDLPPDELNEAAAPGLNFGFPYCHGGTMVDPQFGAGHACNEFTAPMQTLGAHIAALGMRFYTGTQFPAEYRNQIFIAEHGSAARSTPDGYRVALVRLDASGRAVSYEPFATGWLQNGRAWGRPVDVQVMPDGSMLVSDDTANAIYQVSYGA